MQATGISCGGPGFLCISLSTARHRTTAMRYHRQAPEFDPFVPSLWQRLWCDMLVRELTTNFCDPRHDTPLHSIHDTLLNELGGRCFSGLVGGCSWNRLLFSQEDTELQHGTIWRSSVDISSLWTDATRKAQSCVHSVFHISARLRNLDRSLAAADAVLTVRLIMQQQE